MMRTDAVLAEKDRNVSHLTGWLTLISAVFVLTALLYGSWRVAALRVEVANETREIQDLKNEITLRKADLHKTESYVLDFLGSVTNREQVQLLDPGVSWTSVS